MASNSADRNLLIGVLALQMNFVTREQLVNAMGIWVLNKEKKLDQIFAEQKNIDAKARELLDSFVDKHLELHGGNLQDSLAVTMATDEGLQNALSEVVDTDLENSIQTVSTRRIGESTSPLPASSIPSPKGRYHVLRPHARGGLGKVSIALDQELNREVALKEILDRHAENHDSRTRFVLEAEITGSLEHPGIVPVYGFGQDSGGLPFYAMRFIRGESLQDAIDELHSKKTQRVTDVDNGASVSSTVDADASFRSVTSRRLLQTMIEICNAIEYAHSRAIVHRDIKPNNVMLGKYGETLVVDWGLAKPTSRDNRHSIGQEQTLRPVMGSNASATEHGSVVGTPAYMSPEQAAGRLDQVGPLSDVYSLGATMFHLLTGERPFKECDSESILSHVQTGEFRHPREINPLLPKPLEAICLKAMSKEPKNRYSSPRQLANDLDRFLADDSIHAFDEPFTARTRRWMRRHPRSVAALAATIVVSLTGLLVFSTIISSKNGEISSQNTKLEETNGRLNSTVGKLEASNDKLSDSNRELERQKQMLEQANEAERRSNELAKQGLFDLQLGLAQQRLVSDPDSAILLLEDEQLCPKDRRDFVWNLFHRWARKDRVNWLGHEHIVTFAEFTNGSRELLTASLDGKLKHWDIAAQEMLHVEEFDDPILAGSHHVENAFAVLGDSRGKILIWDSAAKKVIKQLQVFDQPVLEVVISPNGGTIAAISNRRLAVIDSESYQVIREFGIAKGGLRCVTFHPFQSRLYVAGYADEFSNGLLFCFQGDKYANVLQTPNFPEGGLSSLGVTSDGSHLIALTAKGRLTRISTSDYTARANESRTIQAGTALKISPVDGSIAAAFCESAVASETMSSRMLVESKYSLPPNLSSTRMVRYSESSQEPFYRKLEVWNEEGSIQLGYIPRIPSEIASLAYSSDGRLLVAGDGNGTISVIDVRGPQEHFNFPVGEPVGRIRFSTDSQTLVANDKLAWSTKSGTKIDRGDVELSDTNRSEKISPEERKMIADAAGIEDLAALTVSPDGRLLAFYSDKSRLVGYTNIWLWDLAEETLLHQLEGHTAEIYDLTFSPDSKNLASCGYDQSVRVWDVATGAETAVFSDHRSTVLTVRFSPDGSMLASGSYDETVKVWAIQSTPQETVPWPVLLDESLPFNDRSTDDSLIDWSREAATLKSLYERLEARADFVDDLSYHEEAIQKIADEFNAIAFLQYSKGQLRMYAETVRQAVAYYERLVDAAGESSLQAQQSIAQTCLNLSDIYLKLEEYPLSIQYGRQGAAHLESLIEKLDDDLELRIFLGGCLNNIGMALDAQEQYEDSLDLYVRAIAIQNEVLLEQPNDPRAESFRQNHWFNLARCYRRLGRFDKCLETLNTIEKVGQSSVATWYKIASERSEVWLAAGDSVNRDELCTDLLSALQRAYDLGFPAAQIGKADPIWAVALQLADDAWRLTQAPDATVVQLKRAGRLCEQALAISSTFERFQLIAATVLYRKGEIKNAHAAFQKLAEDNWENRNADIPIMMAFYALTSIRNGDRDLAARALKKYEESMENSGWSSNPDLIRIGEEAGRLMMQ